MIGKIEYWSADWNDKEKGFGFIVVRDAEGGLDKFFVLGRRVLFESKPQIGDVVEFEVTNETPRTAHGYPLVTNVRRVKPIIPPLHPEPSDIAPLIGKDGGK